VENPAYTENIADTQAVFYIVPLKFLICKENIKIILFISGKISGYVDDLSDSEWSKLLIMAVRNLG